MTSQLSVRKLYIDSAHKVSGTDGDFRCELKETILCPENAVFRIVDVAIPNTFTTIMTGINDKFYFYVSNTNHVDTRPHTGYISTLDAKNYSGTEFATELQAKMRASHGTTNFSVVFNAFNQNITISTDVSNHHFFRRRNGSDRPCLGDGFCSYPSVIRSSLFLYAPCVPNLTLKKR